MAFHVACPITCRRICYCSLGFPPEFQNGKGKTGFLEEIDRLKAFLEDPWLIKDNKKTVQVLVPKVAVVPPPPLVAVTPNAVVVDGGRGDAAEDMSAYNKRVAMQKQAAAASLVAEDYARRFESGDTVGSATDLSREEQVLSNAKIMCRLCFSGENEGSERARKMLSCKSCNKKYHRSCLKAWAHDRDLFHWSSWTCPSCRICEVCKRTGDPNKLMFCKRCDSAYHCYCQHPPHKNVSKGPYLCPKHTRCHSCASTVPGNGSSLRWFLGYTCCDACGRLFVKGNYCPVCLKVYRDSESTPMVCCDICQRWVHCHCDGISDEKYLHFQVNNHLEYRCASCRGECYQVRDLEDAVQELWRRRDKAEQDLIANLRAAAGLPTQEEIFAISPYSDDEDDGPALKKEYGHSLKFSLKGVVDKSPKKSKENTKKSSNKKYGKEKQFPAAVFGRTEPRVEGHSDAQSVGSIVSDNKDEDMQSYRNVEPDMLPFPLTRSSAGGVWSVDAAEDVKRKLVNEVPSKTDRKIFRDKVNNYKHQMGTVDDTGKDAVKSNKNTKERKLVIHLGARNKNVASSPKSDASNPLLEQAMTAHNGGGDLVQQRANDNRFDLHDNTYKVSDVEGDNTDQANDIGQKLRGKGGNLITMKKPKPEHPSLDNHGANWPDFPEKARVSFGKRSTKRSAVKAGTASETLDVTGEKMLVDLHDDNIGPRSVSHTSQKELKPSLRLKFKNVYSDDQSSWASPGEEDKSFAKGQRSKRKRPPPSVDKSSSFVKEDKGAGHSYEGKDMMGEIMDANWIIQKLGEHAIGKMVEVHQPSNNSWHKGTVIKVSEDTSTVSVTLNNGKAMSVDLGKQGIRFVSQKHRQ